MKRVCITGGAGFIGSTLADQLIHRGAEVVILDNFATGRREFVADFVTHPDATLIEGDVLDPDACARAIEGCDAVFHLQANADVRFGMEHPRRDLEQNMLSTSNVLEAMRAAGCRRIGFASTGSIYGDHPTIPTPENAAFPAQTSLYGASKLGAEGMIGAYCHALGFLGVTYRFVSILGERYTHGHVYDFYRALRTDPTRLRVLGDGQQRKSYLYVGDCIDGILTAFEHHADDDGAHVYNLGTEATLVVDESVRIICEHLGLQPVVEHSGGARGWPGDSPHIHLDTAKIRSLGWSPQLNIQDAVVRTLDWFDANPTVVLKGVTTT